MINKRKLDELINEAIHDSEKLCGYTFEEYCAEPFYREHVCEFVCEQRMPNFLAVYLYEDCYCDDLETVKANLNYVNSVMATKSDGFKEWVAIPLNTIIERIELHKKDAAEKEAIEMADCYDIGDIFLD